MPSVVSASESFHKDAARKQATRGSLRWLAVLLAIPYFLLSCLLVFEDAPRTPHVRISSALLFGFFLFLSLAQLLLILSIYAQRNRLFCRQVILFQCCAYWLLPFERANYEETKFILIGLVGVAIIAMFWCSVRSYRKFSGYSPAYILVLLTALQFILISLHDTGSALIVLAPVAPVSHFLMYFTDSAERFQREEEYDGNSALAWGRKIIQFGMSPVVIAAPLAMLALDIVGIKYI